MSNHKVDFRRPDFLLKFISDNHGNVNDMYEFTTLIPGSMDLLYCAYNALIDMKIPEIYITKVACDNETVALYISDKQTLKQLKNNLYNTTIMLGSKEYNVSTKIKNHVVIISATVIEDLEQEEEED